VQTEKKQKLKQRRHFQPTITNTNN